MMKHLLISLSLLLAGVSLAEEPSPSLRRDEARFLNQAIPSAIIEDKLRIWEGSGWRVANPVEGSRTKAKVLVVNVWATYCTPCLTEFPVLRDMAQRIEADYQKDVQFIFLSETTDPQLMKEFVAKNVKILPQKIPLYLDENENFARILRYFQRGGSLSLPTTIILDENRNIRYAMIGAVLDRRSELVNAIDDIMGSIQQRNQK